MIPKIKRMLVGLSLIQGLGFLGGTWIGVSAATEFEAVSTSVSQTESNLWIGPDPADLPANRRAQAEPHMARSYTDPNLLVATFQEGRFEDSAAYDCGFAVSTNGGINWSRALIPHLVSSVDGGPYLRASDPVAGLDRSNTIYLNILAVRATEPRLATDAVICRSRDGGRTFQPPIVVFTPKTTNDFPDKNWMVINTFPDTPTTDRIAVTYTHFTPVDYRIELTYSDDGAQTWSVPRALSSPISQGSQPVFLPDGSLAVIYMNLSGARIEIVYSKDGGQNFGPIRTVADLELYHDSVARDGSILPAAAGDRQAGVLYVVCQALMNGPRILFVKSIDQGQTWSAPKVISDNPAGVSVFNPALAVSPDGQHVTVIFYDKRNAGGAANLVDLYLAQSFDGGDTWAPNVRLSEVKSDLTLAPLTASGRMLGDYQGMVPALGFDAPAVAIWIDTRTGSPDPFIQRIARTQGTRFETWRRLRFSPSELANLTLSGESADPDGDGLPNLMEYALAREPRHFDSNPLAASIGSFEGHPALAVSLERLTVLSDAEFVWQGTTDWNGWQGIQPDLWTVERSLNPLFDRLTATFRFQSEPGMLYRLGSARK